MDGWITLNRSLLDHYIWHGEPFTRGQAWVDLLLLANHAPTRTMIDGQIIDLDPGSYVTSIRRLADRWERSTKWTLNFLSLLEHDNMIETKVVGNGNAKRTVLFIVKYGIYQASFLSEETQRNTQRKRKGNAKETQNGGKGVIDNPINNIYIQQCNNETIPPIIPPNGGKKKQDELENEFNELWKLYPKKRGRANALKDYCKARKDGTTKEEIENGLKQYVSECERTGRETQYIADGSTWFHKKRWEDDYSNSPYETQAQPRQETMAERLERLRKEGRIDFE